MKIGDEVYWVEAEPKDRRSLKSGWLLVVCRGTVLAADSDNCTLQEERVFGGVVIRKVASLYTSSPAALIAALKLIDSTNNISVRPAFMTTYGT